MTRDYLTLIEAIELHQKLIELFGGAPGIREMGALESALMRPQMGYYENITEEASSLMESLAMNHPFIDGNKRIAFFATDVFLRMNGFSIDCDNQTAYTDFMAMFESSTFDFHHLKDWLSRHIIRL